MVKYMKKTRKHNKFDLVLLFVAQSIEPTQTVLDISAPSINPCFKYPTIPPKPINISPCIETLPTPAVP